MDDRERADSIARIKIEIEKILGPEYAEAYARELTFAVVEADWQKQRVDDLPVYKRAFRG